MADEKPIDLFSVDEKIVEGNVLFQAFSRKPEFGRYSTFEEDLIELREKWKGKDEEILIQHMIDSIIIFLHNRRNMKGDVQLKKLQELMLTDKIPTYDSRKR